MSVKKKNDVTIRQEEKIGREIPSVNTILPVVTMDVMKICPVAVQIFKFGQKCWTNRVEGC